MLSEQHGAQSWLTERHSNVHRHIKRFVFYSVRFSSRVFFFLFLSCHFLVLCFDLSLKRRWWKEKKMKEKKKTALVVVRLNRDGATGRGHTRGRLIQSLWTLFFFFVVVV